MHPIRTTWEHVRVGSYIRSQDGVDWKVVKSKEGFWGLQSRSGEQKILPAPKPTAAVDILHLTPDELEGILRRDFGAEVHSVKREIDQVMICEPFGHTGKVPDMRSHIFMMHGHWAQEAALKRPHLIELHDEMHADPSMTQRWIPHVHAPLPDDIHW